jgi:hypothetical protein
MIFNMNPDTKYVQYNHDFVAQFSQLKFILEYVHGLFIKTEVVVDNKIE